MLLKGRNSVGWLFFVIAAIAFCVFFPVVVQPCVMLCDLHQCKQICTTDRANETVVGLEI